MKSKDAFAQNAKISESPTLPGTEKKKSGNRFDLQEFLSGPLSPQKSAEGKSNIRPRLDEKLRQAYFWITNYAIISPFYDIEYHDAPAQSIAFDNGRTKVTLPTAQSYSSFVLMPLLNLVTRRRLLFIGGPGRGKTASAILMGVLAGYSIKEIKRAIQHGQPQMTISDLLGNPLPSDLMNAKSMDEIKIAWRKWLGMRVKIIDEYNRIPTRTQSALLTVMADNYAEIMDQIFECPEAAWYLTANDDAGGGTYAVIEALRDRIDVVVKALHFNTRFIGDLLRRIEAGAKPEEMVPSEIIFTKEEIDEVYSELMEIEVPEPLMRRLEFFTSQFEFYNAGAEQIEYQTKDTVKISGLDFRMLENDTGGNDRLADIGDQTRNGLSVRAIMTTLAFLKALSYFRGESTATLDDMRQILPFVLHDKLVQNPDSPFFEQPGNQVYRVDRVSWIRKLFDMSNAEYDRLNRDKHDTLRNLEAIFEKGLVDVPEKEASGMISKIEAALHEIAKGKKIYGPQFDDILKLKYLHQRYTNYLNWLKASGG
ncbi:MAG: AAA family ATPase [Leptospiraceae bacterium]|nr:AAA family ATPase [Leptospiraceae bacterium]